MIRFAWGCSVSAFWSAVSGIWVIDRCGDLNEFLGVVRITGQKIHLESIGSLDVGDFSTTTLQFRKDDRFLGMAGVCLAAAIENGSKSRVSRVNFAWIDLTTFFGIGSDRNGLQKESVF